MSNQELDGSIPKLVSWLLSCSRKYPFDASKGVDETKAHRHDTFTFKNRPGWRIDVYQFGIIGISTEFQCKVTTPSGQIEYCWFKSGIEFDQWKGSLDHYFYWEAMPECKANTRKEIAENGTTFIYPPPAPEYIEGCSCISCNKDGYDGLEWNVGEQIDRSTAEEKKEVNTQLKKIFDMFKGVPRGAMPGEDMK